MTKDIIRLEMTENKIGIIHMQDEASKNCLSSPFVSRLEEIIRQVSEDQFIKVVVFKGLDSVFCAGADLETLKQLSQGTIKPIDIQLPKLILGIPVPTISAMEGHAIGGGLALGLCADMVFLAEESRYGCSFMNMGFTPGMGITKLMEHFMAPAIAHELLYTGVNKKGRDLKETTHINGILPKQEVFETGLDVARSIAEKPRHPLKLLKRYLSMSRRQLFEETLSIESMMHDVTFNRDSILKDLEENYVR